MSQEGGDAQKIYIKNFRSTFRRTSVTAAFTLDFWGMLWLESWSFYRNQCSAMHPLAR